MNALQVSKRVAAVAVSLAVCSGLAFGDDVRVTLVGGEEVPPVNTPAKGDGKITIKSDKTVSGGITTTGLAGTKAHIHQGAIGVNGPPIVTLTKRGDNEWVVPDGAKLTDAQYGAYKAGDLYVNVHTAKHKDGEIRGQLHQP